MQLSERLALIASKIPKGHRVADIGTDHAYLPIFLRQEDICPSVLACDIRMSPLKSAMKNVYGSGVNGIEFRLCDGLEGIDRDEVDTVVIAGMGGECIAGILERCRWAEGSGKRFVLQPMNSPEELRKYLCGRYTPVSESAVCDAGRAYTVITVEATADSAARDDAFFFTGLLCADLHADREFLQKQYVRLKNCADGLVGIEGEEEKHRYYHSAANIIKEFLGV